MIGVLKLFTNSLCFRMYGKLFGISHIEVQNIRRGYFMNSFDKYCNIFYQPIFVAFVIKYL